MGDKMIPGDMDKDNKNLSCYRVFKHEEVNLTGVVSINHSHGCSSYCNIFDLFDFISGLCI